MSASLSSLCLLVVSTGCAPSVRLRWELEFAEPALGTRAEVVVGRILADGCDSGTVLYAGTARRGETPPMPPTLASGRYGFEGTARDGACVVFARGCVDVDVPREESALVLVRLSAVPDAPACGSATCRAGLCDAPDGRVDAGQDASLDASVDSGRLDAGLDSGLDAGGTDGGTDAGASDVPSTGALPVGDRLQIDFGPVVAAGWATLDLDATTGPLTSMGGVMTDVVATTLGFTGDQTGGSFVNSIGLPPEVSSDTNYVGTFDGHDAALLLDATVELSGVAPGNYSIELFASRDGDDGGPGRLTRYRVGARVMDLDAQDNTARIARFDTVSPDAGGLITLHVGVSPAGTARFGYIGSLILVRLP